MFANDAMACFDRMVPGISSLIAWKFGMTETVMWCRNETIKKLKRNIRTGCGDSEEYYDDHGGDDPMNGEVQGKEDVASLWCLMSHTILTAHSALHTPIEMMGATKGCKVEKNNDEFVDNTDVYAEAKKWDGESEKEAVSSLQQKAQSWARLIAVLGGAIAFHKCIWQVIGWNYTYFPQTMKTKSEYNIKLTNRTGAKN